MLFIAEIGMNHYGNFDLCYELIKQAKYAGADIAKFQLGWKDGEGEINRLSLDILQQLNKWCDYFEIEFMVSIISEDALALAKKINFRRYKIASWTVRDNLSLVRDIVGLGKETIIGNQVTIGYPDRKKIKIFFSDKKMMKPSVLILYL